MTKSDYRTVRKLFIRSLLVVAAAAMGLVLVALVVLYPKYRAFQQAADSFDLAELNRIPAISEVFDAEGARYGRLEGEVRYVVSIDDLSPNFINALIAREDSRFYQHHGVDFSGIVRAALRNVAAGTVKEGASTITQQLARNTFDLGPDRWRRKMVEALLAQRIERNFTKPQIIEAYANRIYFGIGLYGVETASRACFGKPARDLTLSEAAILAGLIRSPNRFSPLKDSESALGERDQVLGRMEELKMITPAQAAAARAEPMPAGKRQPPRVQENYAMDAVMRDLDVLLPRDAIRQGGLKIFTTIDRRLQMIAEGSVDKKLAQLESEKGWPHPTRAGANAARGDGKPTESPYIQGALVAIDNDTGGIRAIVGGRDYKDSPYNRALLSKRQVGSTFKPFVYAAAFARGLAPGTLISDGPIEKGDIAGLKQGWSPENSDGDDIGMQPAAIGLVRSRNTMTIRVGEYATRAAVRALALQAGLENVPDMPAIYLGGFESTLKSITAAYTMFANNGARRQPYIIDRIEDRAGKILYRATGAQLRCLSPGVNYEVHTLLGDVIARGTATAAREYGLTLPAAGKTGTTNDYKDAWFVGYTTRLTCGVWVGMDRPERIADKGYGSKLALPIWVDFMQQAAERKYEAKAFPMPETLRQVDLCRVSGALATASCDAAGTVYHATIPASVVPRMTCQEHAAMMATAAPLPPAPPSATDAVAPGRPVDYAPAPVRRSVPVARAVDAGEETIPARPAEPVPVPRVVPRPARPAPVVAGEVPVARAVAVDSPEAPVTQVVTEASEEDGVPFIPPGRGTMEAGNGVPVARATAADPDTVTPAPRGRYRVIQRGGRTQIQYDQ